MLESENDVAESVAILKILEREHRTAPCVQREDDRVFSGIVAIALLHFNLYSDIVAIVSLPVVE